MRTSIPVVLGAALLSASAGCNQQDTESLARVGNKVVARAGAAADPLREKLDTGVRGIRSLATVKDRVQARLQWDKQLADLTIDVQSNTGEVELKGTVKTYEQRRRAVELAESTQGVERVTDNMQVAD
jgi:osmotically-inducible protein OsmY